MDDLTRLLRAADAGDADAADRLLPLVYDELRALARARLADEPAGVTLQATGLVHEAYLRLGGSEGPGGAAAGWESRRHFFGAAAEAMRRTLVDRARRRGRLKRGGDRRRVPLDPNALPARDESDDPAAELLALDEALTRFEAEHPRPAAVVKLRYFGDLSFAETAAALGVSRATAVRDWTFGRAWLFRAVGGAGRRGDSPESAGDGENP